MISKYSVNSKDRLGTQKLSIQQDSINMSKQSGITEGGEPAQMIPTKKSGRTKIPSPNSIYTKGSKVSGKSTKTAKTCTTPKPLVSSKSNRILFPSEKDYISKIT